MPCKTVDLRHWARLINFCSSSNSKVAESQNQIKKLNCDKVYLLASKFTVFENQFNSNVLSTVERLMNKSRTWGKINQFCILNNPQNFNIKLRKNMTEVILSL